MRQNKYPSGWDEDRVRKVMAHYEQQSEEEAVAEDEAALEEETLATVSVPKSLIPAIRELITRSQGKNGPTSSRIAARISPFGNGAKSYEADFLVDTGAADSMAPATELEKIGVRREGQMAYQLASGEIKEYSYGLARIELLGELTAGRIIFGEPNAEPILGVTALESVGITVNPASKTLLRLPAIPLK
jgi:clan AA aspartic protease